jgi:hypothetical protein
VKDYAGLAGAMIGGLIALLSVWLTQRRTDVRERAKWERERLDRDLDVKLQACVAYLAACRRYRRFLMYSDVKGEYVGPTDESKGTTTVVGAEEIEAAVNDAAARLMIVVGDSKITDAADALSREVGEVRVARIVKGKGMIPTVLVTACRMREREFAAVVRRCVGLDAALDTPVG